MTMTAPPTWKSSFYYCQEKAVNLLCYCLLSNHMHLLVETPQGNLSRDDAGFSDQLHGLFQPATQAHRPRNAEQRYKAFLVDRDNYLLQVSRYIHLNPVAARLVERPQRLPLE